VTPARSARMRGDGEARRLPSPTVASTHRPEDHPAAARVRAALLTGPSDSGRSLLRRGWRLCREAPAIATPAEVAP